MSPKIAEGDLVSAITQKERRLIINALLQKKRLNISNLAKETGMDRATVSYHLGILEQKEIVGSKYEMLTPPHSMGRIGHFYEINEAKFKEARGELHRLYPEKKEDTIS
jgi:DNA-binding transcriptional ArsR family regulator